MRRYPPVDLRLAEKFEVMPDGCWQWTGARVSGGYGHLKVHGRMQSAHRVAYQIAVGPIPEGLTIDHLCRNRACVNPDHLEAVTKRENSIRGEGIASRARRTHCGNGHEYTPENTRVVRKPGCHPWRVCRACERASQLRSRARRAAA